MSNYTSENLVPVSSAAAGTPAIRIGDHVFQMVVSGGVDVSGTTAQAADVLPGKQFVDSNGVPTSGSMTVLSGGTFTPTSSAIVISGGGFLQDNITIEPVSSSGSSGGSSSGSGGIWGDFYKCVSVSHASVSDGITVANCPTAGVNGNYTLFTPPDEEEYWYEIYQNGSYYYFEDDGGSYYICTDYTNSWETWVYKRELEYDEETDEETLSPWTDQNGNTYSSMTATPAVITSGSNQWTGRKATLSGFESNITSGLHHTSGFYPVPGKIYNAAATVKVENIIFDYPVGPLCFTAIGAASTVTFDAQNWVTGVYYKMNNSDTWQAYTSGTTINLSDGQSVYFERRSSDMQGTSGIGTFSVTGKVYGSGNIQSMFNGADAIPAHGCRRMFYNSDLIQTPVLYGFDIGQFAFAEMFKGCTKLVNITTSLPANTLKPGCYQEMFSGCTSLERAPNILADYISKTDTYSGHRGYNAMSQMFKNCTSLKYGPSAIYISDYSGSTYVCSEMFSGCTSLENAPALLASTLGDHSFYSMFSGCTSLKRAPEITATRFADGSCESMFSGCTALKYGPSSLSTSRQFPRCFGNMFKNCSSLTEAPVLTADSVWDCRSIFENCTSLQKIVVNIDYIDDTGLYHAFMGCSSLNDVTVSFTEWPGGASTGDWMDGVASSGTFRKPSDLPETYGDSNIPTNWTVVNTDE